MATAKIVELDEYNTCRFCDNALANYACPRCGLLYCSLACYQDEKHVECSEEFYKNCLMEELNLDKNEPESKQKMLEILEREHKNNEICHTSDMSNSDEELDSDDDVYEDIARRLQGVDLDNTEEVWTKLTEDEKQEFVAFLKSDNVSDLIPKWNPWWTNGAAKIKNEQIDACPEIVEIKDFQTCPSIMPNEGLETGLYNIVSGYVFTARYFNGEHHDFPQEAVSCISTISVCLTSRNVFESLEFAIASVEQQCLNSDWIVTDDENIRIMKDDVSRIFKGPNSSERKQYILCALSDIHKLLEAAQKPKDNSQEGAFSQAFPNNHFPSVKIESQDNVQNFLEKINYLLSYVKNVMEY